MAAAHKKAASRAAWATMLMSRSERRAQIERIKNRRARYYGQDMRHDPRRLGKAAATACPCSCWLCDPHKRGERSIRELAANEAWRKIDRA